MTARKDWHCITDVSENPEADDWCYDAAPGHDTVEIGPDSSMPGFYSVVYVDRDDDGNVVDESTVGRARGRETAMGVAEGYVHCMVKS